MARWSDSLIRILIPIGVFVTILTTGLVWAEGVTQTRILIFAALFTIGLTLWYAHSQLTRATATATALSEERTHGALNRHLTEVLTSLSDAVVSIDADGRVTFVNRAAHPLLRVSPPDAISAPLEEVLELVDAHSGERILDPYELHDSVGDRSRLAVIHSRSGESKLVSPAVSIIHDADRPIGAVLLLRDQTLQENTMRALIESEQRSSALIESSPDAIFVFVDQKLVFVNRVAVSMFGVDSPRDLVGESILDRFAPEAVERVREVLDGLRTRSEPPSRSVEPMLRADGTRIIAEWSAIPLDYAEAQGVVMFARDVTVQLGNESIVGLRHKLLEYASTHSERELLRAAACHLAALLDSPCAFIELQHEDSEPVIGWLCDDETAQLLPKPYGEDTGDSPLNQALTRMRTTCASVMHETWQRQSDSPDSDAPGLKRFALIPLGEESECVGLIGVANAQSPYSESALALARSFGDAVRAIAIQRRSEIVRRRVESLLRLSSQLARLGAWSVDLRDSTDFECMEVYWSDETAVLHELPPGYRPTLVEAMGFYAPEDRPLIEEAFRECAASGRPYDLELRLVTAGGRPIWAHTMGIALRDEHGKIVSVQGAIQDITERKAAEIEITQYRTRLEELVENRSAELRRANDELVRANNAKSQFLANMSHELRTPLNSIIGFSSILENGLSGPMSDKQLEQVGIIGRSGKHLLELINDVLDLSKIEARRYVVEEAPVDPGALAQEIAESLQPLAEKKGLQLRLDLDPRLVTVSSDGRGIRQVLLNLVGNAVKFTDSGEVGISVRHEAGATVFAVRDTGPGISPENASRVFEAFTQVQSAETIAAGGTGLGLTLSRRLARLMGGDLTLESELGVGSTFTFSIPDSRTGALKPIDGSAG